MSRMFSYSMNRSPPLYLESCGKRSRDSLGVSTGVEYEGPDTFLCLL